MEDGTVINDLLVQLTALNFMEINIMSNECENRGIGEYVQVNER
jgi:hypothetical protein